MKKSNILSLKNVTMLFLIFLLSTFLLIGITYYFSVSKYYQEYVEKNHGFRILYLLLDDDCDRGKLIENLENSEHVEDAFLEDEYSTFGIINEYQSDEFTGEVLLIGVDPGMQKIIAGSDLNDSEYGMICPSSIYPEIFYDENPYDYRKNIDISSDVGNILTLKYGGIKEFKLKLLGVFDRSFDYTDPNVCYVTHKTLRYLNDNTYDYDISSNSGIYVLIDDLKNREKLYEYKGVEDVYLVTTIRSDKLQNIIFVLGIFTTIMISFIVVMSYLFTNRQIINNYRNIGILRIVGYSKKILKRRYYISNIKLCIIAITLSIIVANCFLTNFVEMFLYDNPQLSLMNMHTTLNTVIISTVIILMTVLLSTYISLKRIDNLDILEIIND